MSIAGPAVTINFFTPSTQSSIRAKVPLTVALACTCTGDETVLPGDVVLVGEQTLIPAEEGAAHPVEVVGTVKLTICVSSVVLDESFPYTVSEWVPPAAAKLWSIVLVGVCRIRVPSNHASMNVTDEPPAARRWNGEFTVDPLVGEQTVTSVGPLAEHAGVLVSTVKVTFCELSTVPPPLPYTVS